MILLLQNLKEINLLNKIFGNSIKNTFKVNKFNFEENKNQILYLLLHIMDMKKILDAYIKEKFLSIKKQAIYLV